MLREAIVRALAALAAGERYAEVVPPSGGRPGYWVGTIGTKVLVRAAG